MNKLVHILIIFILFISCNKDRGLDGLWYGAYTIIDNEKNELYEPTLIEFDGDKLITIKFRDYSTGNLKGIRIDTTLFGITDSIINFGADSARIQLSVDSIILSYKDQYLILRKISPTLKNPKIQSECFRGSFLIKSKYYQDSIDFINDSLLIYTGKYDQNFPGKKWEIIEYDGYLFFNPHTELKPVTLIKSCSSNGIEMIYPSIETIDIKLTPTRSFVDKKDLLGNWIEIKNSKIQPPQPPPFSEENRLYKFEFTQDSLKINHNRRIKTYKWDLTSDGKRIYFIDKILENEGSLKLLKLTDSTMTLRRSSNNGFKEDILKFKKDKTAGNSA